VDYKHEFFPPHEGTSVVTDLDRLEDSFEELGYGLEVRRFSEVDLRRRDHAGRYVLYQSAQDPGLNYKGYIEDVLLGLELQGARLVPSFHLFRAQHNKVFLEILRDLSDVEEVRSLSSRIYGSYQEFVEDLDSIRFPAVLKAATGVSGRGVSVVRNKTEAKLLARHVSRALYPREVWKNVYRKAVMKGWRLDSFNRQKFVVQQYVPGLDHEWKTIVFGPKYFVSMRPARLGDFRASESQGPSAYPRDVPPGLLDFIEKVFTSFRAPYASVDVMHDGSRFYLGEVQFVQFTTGALVRNTHHFTRNGGSWTRVDGSSVWEPELAECVVHFIEKVLEA
jgi:glutathione synthase/RimK-type ligase-like ATP-grasp enzyme